MPVILGFYTDLCDEWENPTEEQQQAHSSLVLRHKDCGGAVLLYDCQDKPYDEARCQACCAAWRIRVVAEKVRHW